MKNYLFILTAMISGLTLASAAQAGQLTVHNMGLNNIFINIHGAKQNSQTNEWEITGEEASDFVTSGTSTTIHYASPKIGIIKLGDDYGWDEGYFVNNGKMAPTGFNDATDVYILMPNPKSFTYKFVNIPSSH